MATPPPPSHDRRHNEPLPPPVTSHERSHRHDKHPATPHGHSHERSHRHDKQPATPQPHSHDRRHDKQPATRHAHSHEHHRHDKQPATRHAHSHERHRHDKQPATLQPPSHELNRRHHNNKQAATSPHPHSHERHLHHDNQPATQQPPSHEHSRHHDKQSAAQQPPSHEHSRRQHDKQPATPHPPSHEHSRSHHHKQPAAPQPPSHERRRHDKQPAAPAPSHERRRHDKQPAPAPSHELRRHDKQPAPAPSHERRRHDKQPAPAPSHERRRHDKQPAPAPSHEQHRHEVRRVADESVNSRYRCSRCKMEGCGVRYRCITESCDYRLHEYCRKKTPMTLTLQDQFPDSTSFELRDVPPPSKRHCGDCTPTRYCSVGCRACDVCGEKVLGLVYHCEKSDRDVHPLCADVAKHKAAIRVGDVDFKLSGKKHDAKCILCDMRKLKGSAGNVPGLRYVSSSASNLSLDFFGFESRVSFHISCLRQMTAFDLYGNHDHSQIGQQQLKKDSGYAQFAKLVGSMLNVFLPLILGDPTLVSGLVASIGGVSYCVGKIWDHQQNKKKTKQILGI